MLALIPIELIDDAFNHLVDMQHEKNKFIVSNEYALHYSKIVLFIKYFTRNWIRRSNKPTSRYPRTLWNHSDVNVPGSPITTCRLEAWHRRLNSQCSGLVWSFWHITNIFRIELAHTSRLHVLRVLSIVQTSRPQREEDKRIKSLQNEIGRFDYASIPEALSRIASASRTIAQVNREEREAESRRRTMDSAPPPPIMEYQENDE
uniref:Uncharacterized protein n=1 Tax=Ditylenchus dipsaci TaxID=166011 RepID=A0A915D4Y7_9BILA